MSDLGWALRPIGIQMRVFMPLQNSLSGKLHVIEHPKNFDTLGGVEKTKQKS